MYFVVMPRVNLIVILMIYVRYLYSINCPTVICLPNMCYLSYGETPLVNCGPRSNFLYIAISFYFYSHCLLSCAYYYPFTTRYAQSFVYSKSVRLTTSSSVGSKILGCIVCRFHVAARWRRTSNISGAIVWSVTKLASITFWSLAFSYWFNKPWFHNWGKTYCCAHHTFLLGFPTSCTYKPSMWRCTIECMHCVANRRNERKIGITKTRELLCSDL
jgi:hypothetical protein